MKRFGRRIQGRQPPQVVVPHPGGGGDEPVQLGPPVRRRGGRRQPQARVGGGVGQQLPARAGVAGGGKGADGGGEADGGVVLVRRDEPDALPNLRPRTRAGTPASPVRPGAGRRHRRRRVHTGALSPHLAELAAGVEAFGAGDTREGCPAPPVDENAAARRGRLVPRAAQAPEEAAHRVERQQRQRDAAKREALGKLGGPQPQELGPARVGCDRAPLLRVRLQVDAHEAVLRVALPLRGDRRSRLENALAVSISSGGSYELLFSIGESLGGADGVADRRPQFRRQLVENGKKRLFLVSGGPISSANQLGPVRNNLLHDSSYGSWPLLQLSFIETVAIELIWYAARCKWNGATLRRSRTRDYITQSPRLENLCRIQWLWSFFYAQLSIDCC